MAEITPAQVTMETETIQESTAVAEVSATSARPGETLAWRRLAVTGGLIVALAVGSAAAGATMVSQLAGPGKATAPEVTEPEPTGSAELPPTDPPTGGPTASPSASPSVPPDARPATAFTPWAARLTGPLAIPQVALEAYGYAEWVLQQTRPTCKLQWTTLAAIGKVTTEHGKQDGSSLDHLGRQRPALIGPPLNGTGGNPRVHDTDGGALDRDQNWDRTLGPMQFIASMWRVSGVDADGDEIADPQDIDDAALAAAYHLCAGGQDLSVVANWKAAVTGYHGLAGRIDKIFEEAQAYGVKSRS